MSVISAQLVKELRDTTGAGMMDCKKALEETAGDLEAAVDWLRAKGISKAAKKADRVAAEGLVAARVSGTTGVVIELNAETDFLARNEQFQALVGNVASVALGQQGAVEATLAATYPASSKTVADALTEAVATIGENMTLRRAASLTVSEGVVGSYVHNAVADGMGKIAVIVALESKAAGEELATFAKQLAMHIAACSPLALDSSSVEASIIEREKAVLLEKATASGKPANVIEKIVENGLKSYFKEVCLVEQAYVHDGSKTVAQAVAEMGNKLGSPVALKGYVRFVLGEGVEKQESDFAAEVAAAAGAR